MRIVIQNVAEAPVHIVREVTKEQYAFLIDIAAALNELGGTACDPELRIYTEQDKEFQNFMPP
jgi:hypothetical protein